MAKRKSINKVLQKTNTNPTENQGLTYLDVLYNQQLQKLCFYPSMNLQHFGNQVLTFYNGRTMVHKTSLMLIYISTADF
jgi:predicted nicotinamide N-methyase